MDSELLRTFLEVEKTRHFGKAAENLYLTQAAVSFRIRQLENQLGSPLFSRQRGNVHLTVAGKRLLPYAESILQTWSRARQDVGLSDNAMSELSIGASNSIWELDGISNWLNELHANLNNTAFRLASFSRQNIIRALLEKNVDVALLGDPPKVEGFQLKEVARFKFKLVTNQAGVDFEQLPDELPLLYFDWSTRLSVEFARIAQLQKAPILHSSSSPIILNFLLKHPSMAYLPEPVIAQAMDNKRLHKVDNSPVMEQTVCLCWREDNEKLDLIELLTQVDLKFHTRDRH